MLKLLKTPSDLQYFILSVRKNFVKKCVGVLRISEKGSNFAPAFGNEDVRPVSPAGRVLNRITTDRRVNLTKSSDSSFSPKPKGMRGQERD